MGTEDRWDCFIPTEVIGGVRRFSWAVAVTACLLAAAGCAARLARPVTDPALALRPGSAPALIDDGDVASLRQAVEHSLGWLAAEPPERRLVFGPRTITAAEQRRALEALRVRLADDPLPAALAAWVAERFEVLESVGGPDGAMLVTGYYEPVIAAAEAPSAEYAVPILGVPDDLVEASLEAFDPRWRGDRISGRVEQGRLVPYWTRGDIEAGRLAGRGLELYWARDP